jgi:hypothetical protein
MIRFEGMSLEELERECQKWTTRRKYFGGELPVCTVRPVRLLTSSFSDEKK